MIKIRFIKDGSEGKTSRWRYKKDEVVLLPDEMALEAINDEIAIRIDRPRRENAVDAKAYHALEQAKRSLT